MNESLDLTVTSEMHQAPLDQAKNQLVPSGANGPADGMQELTNLLAGADTSLGTAPKLTSSLARGTPQNPKTPLLSGVIGISGVLRIFEPKAHLGRGQELKTHASHCQVAGLCVFAKRKAK